MFSESYFADFVGIVIIFCKWEPKYLELSRVGELSLAEHLQGARVTLVPG